MRRINENLLIILMIFGMGLLGVVLVWACMKMLSV